ncbi:MAG: hypothetical protein AB1489_41590, partial [Acidobacteriota bacterium]
YDGRVNEPLETTGANATDFDDPPYCMFAEEFCVLLSEKKFKKAHTYLSPALKENVSAAKLKEEWQRMTQRAATADVVLALQQHMVDWPSRKAEEIGWCYLSVSAGVVNEAVSVVVGRTPRNWYWVTEVEFGRP